MKNLFGPSWKTTFGGVLSLIGAACLTHPKLSEWSAFFVALGSGMVGLSARDNNVTSEQAHAKEP